MKTKRDNKTAAVIQRHESTRAWRHILALCVMLALPAARAATAYGDSPVFAINLQSPLISVPPQSQTVAAGSSAVFSVIVGGLPPLSYQWQFNGQNIPSATGFSLTLNSVTAANAGAYDVVVNNAYGSAVSSIASLTISGNPANWNPSYITVIPSSAPADGSTKVTATVTLLDNNANPLPGKSVKFYAQGQTDPIPLPGQLTDANGQTSTTLTSKTAGTAIIGAVDVSDSFPVPNTAPVQFTIGTVPPGTDLSNAIVQLYNEASFDLATYIPNLALNEGQNGDYFQNQIGVNQADNATLLISSELGIVAPFIPASDEVIKGAVQEVLLDKGQSLAVSGFQAYFNALAGSSSGCTVLAQSIAAKNTSYQQILLQKEQSLLAGVPPVANNHSSAYVYDLNLRLQANQNVLRNEVLQSQHDLVDMLYTKSANGQIDILGPFFEVLGHMSDLADVFCSPVAGVALQELINTDQTLILGASKQQTLNGNQQAYATALSTLTGSLNYSGSIYSNTFLAFNAIAQARQPNPVSGSITTVNSQMSAVPANNSVIGILANWIGQAFNAIVYDITGENTYVTVNNNGTGPANYTAIAVYTHTISVQGDNAGIGLYSMTLPVLASATMQIYPQQSGQLDIYYGDENHGLLPDVGSPIAIYVLGGDSSGNIFYVGQSSTSMQWPANNSSAIKKITPLYYQPQGGPNSTTNLTFQNPIQCSVIGNPVTQTYQENVTVANPFAIPLQAVVTQPLPAGLTVLSTTGLVSSTSVIWTNQIVTNGVIMDTLTFSLPVPPGVQTNLPAPTLVFTDATGTNSLTVQAATPVFSGLFPTQLGTPSIPAGTYGTNTPIQIGITNPAALGESGSLIVSITDASGNAVTNFTGGFSLMAGAGTNLAFTVPGSLPVGQYFVTGTLNLNGGSGQAFSAVYVVPSIPVSLQPIISTNGMLLALQGPVSSNFVIEATADLVNWTPIASFTSTNSPSYFTDTLTSNAPVRFYRALMVPLTQPAPVFSLGIPLPATFTANGLALSLNTPGGLNMRIDVSTNLTDWTPLVYFPTTNGTMSFFDPAATGVAARFYRAVSQ